MTARATEVQVRLAGQESVEVSLCEHGMIHLRLGGVTAHLSRATFERVCGAVQAARERLRRGEPAPCEPGPN